MQKWNGCVFLKVQKSHAKQKIVGLNGKAFGFVGTK